MIQRYQAIVFNGPVDVSGMIPLPSVVLANDHEAAIKQLVGLLKKYADHWEGCSQLHPCECGLDAALAAVKGDSHATD